MKIIPKQGVAQYSHRSACVRRTEAPGRHSTQTQTQASPAVAESEARWAIGFLVVDNSGPAVADSEFAASVTGSCAARLGYVHGRCRGG